MLNQKWDDFDRVRRPTANAFASFGGRCNESALTRCIAEGRSGAKPQDRQATLDFGCSEEIVSPHSSREIRMFRGASTPSFTEPFDVRTTVIVMSSPSLIVWDILRVRTSIE